MVLRDKTSKKFRFCCDVCPFRSRRYETRIEADDAERRHLINMHGGAEVFDKPPPPTPDEDRNQDGWVDVEDMSEEEIGAFFGSIFGLGSLVD